MQPISLQRALLRQKPRFLCGIRKGCVGGSGSINCYDSKAMRLLGWLPQRHLSLRGGRGACGRQLTRSPHLPLTKRSLHQKRSDRLTARHQDDAEMALAADPPEMRHISMCSCALAANSHVQARDREVPTH